MFKIQVKNFQSIVDASLVVDGLTVLTGPNSVGKSALFRAFKGVFTNARNSKSFVRIGSQNCDVLIQLPSGDLVRWEKGEKTNRYTVNGKVLDKVGAGTPEEVSALGVAPVKVGDQQLFPQIAQQFSGQVFLIDQTGSVMAEAISDTGRVARLNASLRESEQDKRTASVRAQAAERDLQVVQSNLDQFQGFAEAQLLLNPIPQLILDLQKVEAGVAKYSQMRDQHQVLQESISLLLGSQQIPIPDVELLKRLLNALQDTEKLLARQTATNGIVTSLEPSCGIQVPVLESLVQDHREIQSLTGLLQRLLQQQSRNQALQAVPQVQIDLTEAQTLARESAQAQDLQDRYQKALNEVHSYESFLANTTKTLMEVKQVLAQHLQDCGECPVCGTQQETPNA